MVSRRGEIELSPRPGDHEKQNTLASLGITNLSEAGGEIKRQGERYVDAIRSGEDVQVIELKHKESMEKSSGVAECMNAR
jgi:hypothetical protein